MAIQFSRHIGKDFTPSRDPSRNPDLSNVPVGGVDVSLLSLKITQYEIYALQKVETQLNFLQRKLKEIPLEFFDEIDDFFEKAIISAKLYANFIEQTLKLSDRVTPQFLLNSEVLAEWMRIGSIFMQLLSQMELKIVYCNCKPLKKCGRIIGQSMKILCSKVSQMIDNLRDSTCEALKKELEELNKVLNRRLNSMLEYANKPFVRRGFLLQIDLGMPWSNSERESVCIVNFDKNLDLMERASEDLTQGKEKVIGNVLKIFYLCKDQHQDITDLIVNKRKVTSPLACSWEEVAHHLNWLESCILACSALEWTGAFVVLAAKDMHECAQRLTHLKVEIQSKDIPISLEEAQKIFNIIDELCRLLYAKEPLRKLSYLCSLSPLGALEDIRKTYAIAMQVFNQFIEEEKLPHCEKVFVSRKDKLEESVFNWIDLNINVYEKTKLEEARSEAQKYLDRIDKEKIKKEWNAFVNVNDKKRKRESAISGAEKVSKLV